VVLAKLTALAVLSLATLVLTFLPALAGGGLFFGFTPDLLPPLLLGYLASWGRDLGLLSLAFLCSTFFPSVGPRSSSVALFLMADLGARLLLKLAGMMGMASAETIAQFLPGAALDAWSTGRRAGSGSHSSRCSSSRWSLSARRSRASTAWTSPSRSLLPLLRRGGGASAGGGGSADAGGSAHRGRSAHRGATAVRKATGNSRSRAQSPSRFPISRCRRIRALGD
jgi:hypothetical protein